MKNLDTICVQGGYTPKSGEPRVTPIVQSTTYAYEKASELADLFDLKADGYFYTRLANPTVDVFEKKLCMLDGGGAILFTEDEPNPETMGGQMSVLSAEDYENK